MIRSLGKLVSIQFKEFFREPEIIFWAFAFPIVLSWLLGIAIDRGSSRGAKVGVIVEEGIPVDSTLARMERMFGRMDAAETAASTGDSLAVGAHASFTPMKSDEAIRALRRGEISLFVEVPPDGRGVTYHFDPRSEAAAILYLSLERSCGAASAAGSPNRVVALDVQGTRYIDFLIPGLLAMSIMNSAMWGIGWSLIEIRMKKLLRRMAATPMPKPAFLASFFITRLIVNSVEFLALFIFANLYFGVRIQGSLAALAMIFIAGNIAFAGIAVCVSSRTANSRVGNGLINAISFPLTLLSGIFFSYHNFPAWAVPIVEKLPLTMLADSMRAVFSEGARLVQVAGPSAALAVLGLLFFFAGIRMFRWY